MSLDLSKTEPKDWVASELPLLRQEVMLSEGSRMDLLKWKLVLVAGLGSAGLGLHVASDSSNMRNFGYLLAIIPLICVYVDLLLLHLNLRIIAIGNFLLNHKDEYEIFCYKRRNIYALEDWALKSSTRFLSILIILYGIITLIDFEIPTLFSRILENNISPQAEQIGQIGRTGQSVFIFSLTLIISGVAGLILSFWFQKKYQYLLDKGLEPINKTVSKTNQTQQTYSPKGDSPGTMIQNIKLLDLIMHLYTPNDIRKISAYLKENGTLNFPSLKNGLFPAAQTSEPFQYTGYKNVWVRDNIHIAHAHYINGQTRQAAASVRTMADYFKKYQSRFTDIIEGEVTSTNPMNRPHVRFNGENIEEIDQQWAHAQNDALGYFLWLFCKMSNEKVLEPDVEDMELLALFPKYFNAIQFWQDEDSGHWEETRKIEASSIGVVTAGLKGLKKLLDTNTQAVHHRYNGKIIGSEFVDKLINNGLKQLHKILPNECIQDDPMKKRQYDAALLFLIYPLEIVNQDMADIILSNVINNLQGDYGVRRYPGDSFWSPDYKKKLSPESRTADFSEDISKRDAMIAPGEEAQWCIFDPIISIIYGRKYQHHQDEHFFLEQQVKYFNRALGQLTESHCIFGEFKCPEAYYLDEGKRVPNDATPLLWTQANLWMALYFMEQSLKLSRSQDVESLYVSVDFA